MTIDQAVEYLLNHHNWRGVATSNQITTWRARYLAGELKDGAKLNIIRRSGIFEEFIKFELKNK